jgi:hypothetical protein
MLVIGRKNNELLIFQDRTDDTVMPVAIRVAYSGLDNNHPEFCRLYRGTRKVAGFTEFSQMKSITLLGYEVTLCVTEKSNESKASIGIQANYALQVSRDE